MDVRTESDSTLSLFWRYAFGAAIAWTVILGGFLIWNRILLEDQALELARKEAIANFDKDQGFRLWGTRHGGVYVPVTKETPPSPYLSHIPERDIETPSGRKLTLLNPAYMVRQLMEDYDELYGIRGKITGLVVLRPGNAPDAWEKQALHRLKDGAQEVMEIVEEGGQKLLRMMRPMYMKPGCEKCHGHLGFKLGDFRGGVGVSVPLDSYFAAKKDAVWVSSTSHIMIWFLGLGAIGFGARQVQGRILERDRAEKESRESQDKLAEILAIAPEAVITISPDMTIQLFNQGAERIFGYESKEITGQPLEILMPEYLRDGHQRKVEEFDNSPEAYRLMDQRQEIFGLRKDGTEFPATASVSKLEIAGEKIFTVMLHDITERKYAQELIIAAKGEAETANRAKSEFLAAMSHELRTPLNAILGFADILSNQYFGPISDKYKEYAGDIETSGEHLLTLVNEILDLSAIEAGKQSLVKELLSTEEVVRECERIIEVKAHSNDIDLVTKIPKNLPPLYADKRAAMQILLNLLSNAIKYTPEGGSVTVSAEASNEGTILKVADTGKGIPPENLANLTDPFFRTDADPYLAEQGWGLGLSITKSLIDLHDGTLDIESTLGERTTISVMLPN